jgi:hypothetical protein
MAAIRTVDDLPGEVLGQVFGEVSPYLSFMPLCPLPPYGIGKPHFNGYNSFASVPTL